MAGTVAVSISGRVASVMLDRVAKRNAVNMAMFEELASAGAGLKDDASVRAVVLHGNGEHFCAGIDVSVFQNAETGVIDPAKMAARQDSLANFFQSAAYIWREIPVPVIAALNGCVFGAGLQIAMGADIRYASVDARLSIMEVKWGLIPDMAISTTLRHVVPTDKVRELTYTGRVVGGREAVDIGLATALQDDPLAAAMETAAQIAAKSPVAIRAAKKLINEAWEAEPARALRHEAEAQMRIMAGDDHKEAVLANLEKRMPDFSDPEV